MVKKSFIPTYASFVWPLMSFIYERTQFEFRTYGKIDGVHTQLYILYICAYLSARSAVILRGIQKCCVLFAHVKQAKNWNDGHFIPSANTISLAEVD